MLLRPSGTGKVRDTHHSLSFVRACRRPMADVRDGRRAGRLFRYGADPAALKRIEASQKSAWIDFLGGGRHEEARKEGSLITGTAPASSVIKGDIITDCFLLFVVGLAALADSTIRAPIPRSVMFPFSPPDVPFSPFTHNTMERQSAQQARAQ